jgi:hypothetical protein
MKISVLFAAVLFLIPATACAKPVIGSCNALLDDGVDVPQLNAPGLVAMSIPQAAFDQLSPQGAVVELSFAVGQAGDVIKPRVVCAPANARFAQVMMETVRAWTFAPPGRNKNQRFVYRIVVEGQPRTTSLVFLGTEASNS